MAPDDLVTLLDNFASTFDKFGQPKLTPYVHNQRKAGDPVSGAGRAGPTVQQTPGKGSSSTVAGAYHNPGDKACYRCGSQSHLANKCSLPKEPHTNGKQWVRSGAQPQRQSAHAQSAVQAKAYRCVVNETDASRPVLVVNEGTRSETVADSRDARSTELTQPITIVCENNSGPSVNVCLQAKRQLVHDVDVGNNVVSCEQHPQESYNDGSVNDNRLQLAQLNYVEIKLPLGTVSGIIDSGSELNVIRQDIIHGLDFDPIGEVEFRGIIGEPVRAPIIRIPVRLNDEVLDENDNVSVMFAVCANLNESCILSIPTLCSLTDILNSKSCVDSYNICDNIASDNSVSAVLTRSQAREQESLANTVAASSGDLDIDTSDVTFLDIDEPAINVRSDIGVSNATEFSKEQLADVTLAQAWQLARLNKSHYFVRDNLLFRTLKRCEQELELLVVPTVRRDAIVRMAHADSHFSPRRTKERILTSRLFWEGMLKDCNNYCSHCEVCQLRSRKTVFDRVPIKACVPEEEPFRTMMMDCFGPIKPSVNLKYNYALIIVDVATRYPFCYPLRSLSAKNVCDALVKMFEFTSLPVVVGSDNGSNFRSSLTREMLNRFGVSSRFATAYHPVSIVERHIGTLKAIIGKLVLEHDQNWTTYLGPALFAMRTTINENLGCSPHLLLFGHWPRGPLKYISDTWSGKNSLPTNLSRSAVEYLEDLQSKLKTTQHYAANHLKQEQNRHIQHYNLRARHKSFEPGDRCLILQPASTSSHALRRWKGPATVIEKLSDYSYVVEYNDARYRLHANLLRKFHTSCHRLLLTTILLCTTK